MVQLTTSSGMEVFFDKQAVIAVMNYDPLSKKHTTRVFGVLEETVEIVESVDTFLDRLGLKSSFVKLESAHDVSIWLKAAAVTAVRPRINTADPEGTGAGVLVAGRTFRVRDAVPAVIAALAEADVHLAGE